MKKALDLQGLITKAIDGARTRGLDLGKVARYQLRHYRMHNMYILSASSYEQNILYYTGIHLSTVFF